MKNGRTKSQPEKQIIVLIQKEKALSEKCGGLWQQGFLKNS